MEDWLGLFRFRYTFLVIIDNKGEKYLMGDDEEVIYIYAQSPASFLPWVFIYKSPLLVCYLLNFCLFSCPFFHVIFFMHSAVGV